ncbi:MAG: DNA primase DnaG [archaeon]
MAKTYVDAVKYMIRIRFQIKGVVDKPDIVGAVFGQSEGLLGEEMDLRELQKKGRVGRIEVNVRPDGGNTHGEILVPTSMDMAETSVLAAAIETVDKVGPCESQFVVQSIEDVRRDKRTEIAKRAKELLSRLKMEQSPEIDTLTEEIRSDVRAGSLVEYGRDRLPAGPEIDSAEEVIVVEGRADVVNMLKHGIKNVIGMGGSKISQDIVGLSRRKPLVLFVDGDRGGELNARKLHQIANVSFVAVAPDAKEVEELQQKEIIQSLRRRVPVDEFLQSIGVSSREADRGMGPRGFDRPRGMRDHQGPRSRFPPRENSARDGPRFSPEPRMDRPVENSGGGMERFPDYRSDRPRESFSDRRGMREGSRDRLRGGMRDRNEGRSPVPIHRQFGEGVREAPVPSFSGGGDSLPTFETPHIESHAPIIPAEDISAYKGWLVEVKGKRIAKFLNKDQKELFSVPVRDMVEKLGAAKNVHTIVCDGIITKRLVDAAAKADVQLVVGVKRGKIGDSTVKTIVLE